MKKFVKFVLGGAALAGTACGVVYFLQKVLGWDILHKKDDDDDDIDDFDDDDIDDIGDIGDDDSEDREYVTLDMEKKNDISKEDKSDQKTEDTIEEEKTSTSDADEPVAVAE